MNLHEYQAQSQRTCKPAEKILSTLSPEVVGLLHAQIGITTEAGEFASEVKRAFVYAKEITPEMRAHMAEELGDLMWYVACAADVLQIPLVTMARQNVEKLAKRFPELYSDAAAEARADKGGLGHRES